MVFVVLEVAVTINVPEDMLDFSEKYPEEPEDEIRLCDCCDEPRKPAKTQVQQGHDILEVCMEHAREIDPQLRAENSRIRNTFGLGRRSDG